MAASNTGEAVVAEWLDAVSAWHNDANSRYCIDYYYVNYEYWFRKMP